VLTQLCWQRTGTNRKEPFEGARTWRYYAKVEELLELLAYLDSSEQCDLKLSKRLQAEFEAVLPVKVDDKSAAKGKTPKSKGELVDQTPAAQSAMLAAPTAVQGVADGTAAGELQQAGARPVVMQMPDPFRTWDQEAKKYGDYLAEDDETPRVIASKFGVDVDEIVKMNKHMYDGLHATARFKGGTMVYLPTPTLAGLKRPATATPKDLLGDILKIIKREFEVLPLCPLIDEVVSRWKTAMEELLAEKEQHQQFYRLKSLAHATLILEHSLAVPAVLFEKDGAEEHAVEPRALDSRMLPAHWIQNMRQNWVLEMESASTWAQIGLLLEEMHTFALAGLREVRHYSTSLWFFVGECRKFAKNVRARLRQLDTGKPLVHVPEANDRVVYFRKGHQMHLTDPDYQLLPWDQFPDTTMALCVVEEKMHFRQKTPEEPCYCALRLRPLPQGKELVSKKIFLHNWQTALFPGQQLPHLPCYVKDFRQTIVDVPHVRMPDGGSVILPNSGFMTPAGAAGVSMPGIFSTSGALAGVTPVTAPSLAAAAPSTAAAAAGTSFFNGAPKPAEGGGATVDGAVAKSEETKHGDETVVYTQRTVNEYLLHWGDDFPDGQWINLDHHKYSMQRSACICACIACVCTDV
jgi:hypothetical protein